VTVPIERIDHVQLAMPPGGEDVAVAFYEGLLGIRHVPKPDHLAARGGCWFEDHDVKVHLGVDHDFHPARKAHPALLVTDLPALIEVLRHAGIDVNDDEPLTGYDRVYVDDPFGNRIELMAPAPPSTRA
jgi:catechol 2,3-dioxygenase-like lactoylglutathione lyase family enzyme